MKRRASQWQARLGVDEVRQAQENFEMLFSTPGQPFAIGLQVIQVVNAPGAVPSCEQRRDHQLVAGGSAQRRPSVGEHT
jgi:hypothetical protein